MVFEQLKDSQINLPLIGGVSILAAVVLGGILFFSLRRKKSISLKI